MFSVYSKWIAKVGFLFKRKKLFYFFYQKIPIHEEKSNNIALALRFMFHCLSEPM